MSEGCVVRACEQAEADRRQADEVATAEVEEDGCKGREGRPIGTLDTDPGDRSVDRLLARQGLLDDAVPWFEEGADIANAGVLLAVPFLVHSGIFSVAQEVYGKIGPAFYGLRTTLMAFRTRSGPSGEVGAANLTSQCRRVIMARVRRHPAYATTHQGAAPSGAVCAV